jgi:hypothetical protein
MNEKKRQKMMLEKLPYGIFSGACAMFVFFATLALIAAYLILSGIAAQTSDTVSFFESSWQIALFIFDIIFFIAMIGTFVMYVLKAKGFFSKGSALEEQLKENLIQHENKTNKTEEVNSIREGRN